MKFETAGATIDISKNPDGTYTATLYWKNPECEAEVCKKTVMPAYKVNECKFRLENGYILNQCENSTEVETVNIDKELNKELDLLDKISLKIDDAVFEPVKNLTKKIENTSKKVFLLSALGIFLYITTKK